MPLILALLLLVGCATPRGPWVVRDHLPEEFGPQTLAMIEAAKAVTPDAKGWLARGGTVWWHSGSETVLDSYCGARPGAIITGCSFPGRVDVLFWPWAPLNHGTNPPDITRTALAHELCHIGLETGGGYGGPVRIPSEEQADACALLVIQEYRKTTSEAAP